MKELIDKAALVAWIKRGGNEYPCDNDEQDIGYHCALYEIQDFLDTLEVKVVGVDLGDPKGDKSAKYIIDTETLEVKEVDLEKEWENYFKYKGDMATVNVKHLAKHFFELGLKAKEK